MRIVALVLSLAWVCQVDAQEPIGQEQLEKVVPRLIERAGDQENLPLAMDVRADQAVGMTIKEYGGVALPARGLTKESLLQVSNDITPVGQLWLKRLVPIANEATVPEQKLRRIKIGIGEDEHTLQLLLLGLRKKGEGLELVVFAKGKEPILTLPLAKTQRNQDMPLELNMRRGSTSFGILDIQILGQFEAELLVSDFQP